MQELKVEIAGFGIEGKRRKECIDRHPNVHLIAVCDKTFGRDGKEILMSADLTLWGSSVLLPGAIN